MSESAPAPNGAVDPNAPQFVPQAVYVKDVSFEAPNGPRMPAGFDYPLPPPGIVNLFVLIDGVVRHVAGAEQDFGQNKSPFSPLFHAAHHVIAEMRRIPPPEQRG